MTEETLDITCEPIADGGRGGAVTLAAAIIWHPDLARLGEFAFLSSRARLGAMLSRNTPLFGDEQAHSPQPLAHPYVSRSPVTIRALGKRQYEIAPPDSKMWIAVNGHRISEPVIVSLDELGEDIILSLSDQVVLSLFERPVARSGDAEKHGLLGVSGAIRRVWDIIAAAGPTELPVLIEGPTGTGKELAARAIHQLSSRAERPMLGVNMATVTGDLATADLFGAAKGAFTGSVRDRMGLFEQANDSTLFLDEIGNTPAHVQPMLLRALEAGEIRRVGEARTRRTLARVVAATDQSLGEGQFNQPLLRRLEAVRIEMPPLSARRADIGVLIRHFLKASAGGDLATAIAALSNGWAAHMALYPWPGNVRELRNAVQQIMLGQQPDAAKRALPVPEGSSTHKAANLRVKPVYRAADAVAEEELLMALNESNWCIKTAASSLNISRTALYELIGKSPNIRKVDDLSDKEIREMAAQASGDIAMLARKLRVSRTALKNRINRMSLQ